MSDTTPDALDPATLRARAWGALEDAHYCERRARNAAPLAFALASYAEALLRIAAAEEQRRRELAR